MLMRGSIRHNSPSLVSIIPMPPNVDRAATRTASASSRSQPYPRPEERPSRRHNSDSGGDQSGSETPGGSSTNGPRTTRQQYSACGACRMRRVKCNLKDIAIETPSGQRPSCSNCQERGINCIDEYETGKQVGKQKLLRRGRRIQGAEAVFGKVNELDFDTPSCIPDLAVEFFQSHFFRRFQIQRPIIDPTEFIARYSAYLSGHTDVLRADGILIAKMLVIWAASYGLDEAGNEVIEASSPLTLTSAQDLLEAKRSVWAARVTDMLREIRRYIDHHGILRRPTWDGVRGLLLLLPLLNDGPPEEELERLALLEAAHSQIYTLCSLSPTAQLPMVGDVYTAHLVRARIFWYAYVREGIASGLRGGRLVITSDDLEAFQQTLPRLQMHTPPGLSSAQSSFETARRYAQVVIDISSACRMVHSSLTGPRARQRMSAGPIDDQTLSLAWEGLDACNRKLDDMKQPQHSGLQSPDEEVDRFASGWQLFIFEAHNVIREALKQRLIQLQSPEHSSLPHVRSYIDQVEQLHQKALHRCKNALRAVVVIIKAHLSPERNSPFFAYDAALVRDACFFAAILLAISECGPHTSEDELRSDIDACVQAVRSMRFALAHSSERERSIEQAWERRMHRLHSARAHGQIPSIPTTTTTFLPVQLNAPSMSVPYFRETSVTAEPVWESNQPQRHNTIVLQPLEPSIRTGYHSVPITPTNPSFPSSIAPSYVYSTPPGSSNSRPSTAGDGPAPIMNLSAVSTSSSDAFEGNFHYGVGSSGLSNEVARPLSAPSTSMTLPMVSGFGPSSYSQLSNGQSHQQMYTQWNYSQMPTAGH